METKDLDLLMEQILAARKKYDEAKDVSNLLWGEVKQLEAEFVGALKESGKTQWKIDGLGTGSVVNTMSVPVPKTVEDKRALFEFVLKKYGEDVAFEKFGMHSKTLVSFYNEEYKASADKALFSLPGVDVPTYTSEFRFRKA